MIDTEALLLTPGYDVFGVAAVLTPAGGNAIDVTVVDLTSGTDINARGLDLPNIKPAAMLRVSELEAAGATVADLKGGTLVIGARTWDIVSFRREPLSGCAGEVMLILNDGDA